MKSRNFISKNLVAETLIPAAYKAKKLPVPGNDDEAANFNHIKEFALDIDPQNLR